MGLSSAFDKHTHDEVQHIINHEVHKRGHEDWNLMVL